MIDIDNNYQKVTQHHLQRNAYLYVRQSTIRQVFEHSESTKRQYALRQKGIALGWMTEQIIVIDSDQGQSGANVGREGFQQLVTEVSLGKAGIVMGLEVSRLARNSTDWHRLLEICALTNTLILDEDGIYDPCHFNDRLLLGLKGTMSEAELHILKARLRGGVINKAKRGELKIPLPVGLIYNASNKVILDPNKQVQQSLNYFFETFKRTGSACATVKEFRKQGILFPRKLLKGINKGELLWSELEHSRALQILHNPRYAGTFVFGRTCTTRQINGNYCYHRVPQKDWQVVIPEFHKGYISWETYNDNQQQLLRNAQALGEEKRKSPVREGAALLQGLIICGKCGKRMTVRYHIQKGQLIPDYVCQRDGIKNSESICQAIIGGHIDDVIGKLLVERITPYSLEVSLAVQQELFIRAQEINQLHKQRVENARYEAELARRRYRQVDPENRLVACTLEAEWNEKLQLLEEAQAVFEQQQTKQEQIDPAQKTEVLALANDFPKLWRSPKTSQKERKQMLRLLIEDITLNKGHNEILVQVRFKGGTSKTLTLLKPKSATVLYNTPPEIVNKIDQLSNDHTDKEIVNILNNAHLKSGRNLSFTMSGIKHIRRKYNIKNKFTRLREKGLLTSQELAKHFNISKTTVNYWRRRGKLLGYKCDDREQYLYEKPTPFNQCYEVQYAT